MIELNALFQHIEENKFIRIIHLDDVKKNLGFIEINGESISFPIVVDLEEFMVQIADYYLFIPLSIDPFINALTIELSEKEKARINERFKIVDNLISEYGNHILIPATRNRIIKKVVKNYSVKTVLRYLKLYWKYGHQKFGLQTNFRNSGAKGAYRSSEKKLGRKSSNPYRINMEENDRQNLIISLREYPAENKKNIKLIDIYDFMLSKYYLNEKLKLVKYPSPGQFYHWLKKISPSVLREKKWDTKNYLRNIKMLLHNADRDTLGPGYKFEIDATPTDFYLASTLKKGQYIGRAILILVVDVFTRYIVGYYLGLHKESYYSGNLALLNAFSSKVEHCKKVGINISEDDWHTSPICKKLVGDRGSMISYKSDALTEDLGIEIINARSGRPDEKPYVERFLGMIQAKVKKYLKGENVIPPMKNPRTDIDERKTTWVTLKILRYCTISAIISHNNYRPLKKFPYKKEVYENDLELKSKNIWEHYRNNNISYGKIIPEKILRILLLERIECSFSRKGIHHSGEYFVALDPVINEKLEIMQSSAFSGKLTVYFDPKDLKDTHLKLDGNFYPLRLTTELLDPIEDYYQLQAIQKVQREQAKKHEHDRREHEVKTSNEIDNLIEEAKLNKPKEPNNLKDVKQHQKEEIASEISENHSNNVDKNLPLENTSNSPNPFENPLI